jgi:hypothetical protein
MTGLIRSKVLAIAATAAAALFAAAEAGAVERVADGGFDESRCPPGGDRCYSPAWSQFRFPTENGLAAGPICSDQTLGCNDFSQSGYSSAPHWARVGAGWSSGAATYADSFYSGIHQNVSIPAAPAKLRFNYRIVNVNPSADGWLVVEIDNTTVFSFPPGSSGPNFYRSVLVDVSDFSGRDRRLTIRGQTFSTSSSSDSFDIDDVSLDTPEAPSPPPPSPSPAAETGQRRAALAKCKKKRSKPARKKCRSRAQALPARDAAQSRSESGK